MEKSLGLRLSADQWRDYFKMAGLLKSIEPALMVHVTPIPSFMGLAAVQLGRWATNDSSLTHSQKKAAQALEVLGLEIWAKLEAEDGLAQADLEWIRIRSREKLNGKLPLDFGTR